MTRSRLLAIASRCQALALLTACAHDRASPVTRSAPTLERALEQAGYRDVRRVSDGALIVLQADGKLVAAPHGCTRAPCTTVLGEGDGRLADVRVEPFVGDGWFLVREHWHSDAWYGSGDGERGVVVKVDAPPRVGCEIELSSRSCNSEWGDCGSRSVEVLPGDHEGAWFTLRVTSVGGRVDHLGAKPSCTRYARSSSGTCTALPVECPDPR